MPNKRYQQAIWGVRCGQLRTRSFPHIERIVSTVLRLSSIHQGLNGLMHDCEFKARVCRSKEEMIVTMNSQSRQTICFAGDAG